MSAIHKGDTAGFWKEAVVTSRNDFSDQVKNLLYRAAYREVQGDKVASLALLNQAATLVKDSKNDSLKGFVLASMGFFYMNGDHLSQGLTHFSKSLEYIKENLRDPLYVEIVKNIAFINSYMDNHDATLKNFRIVKNAYELKGDSLGISNVYNVLGITFTELKNFDSAFFYLNASRAIREKRGSRKDVGQSLNNLGTLYFTMEDYDNALKYYQDGHRERVAGKARIEGIIESETNIGKTLYRLKKYGEAEKMLSAVFQKTPDHIELRRRAAEYLKEIYKITGDYRRAFEMQSIYYVLNDSLYGLQKKAEIMKLSSGFEIARRAREDSLKLAQQALMHQVEREKQQEVSAERDKRNLMFILFLGGILTFSVVISFVLFRGNKSKKLQNAIITRQRDELHNKQAELVDSIRYARHLQEAILPPVSQIAKYFPESFVLYRPKAIVAGDFYWMQVMEDRVFIAAGDSTGHGVPGAMVSVVCGNALERAVMEFNKKKPGEVLDKARELVTELFAKSGENVKDGMDISLLCFRFRNNFTELAEVSWSGANNPLWYVQKGALKEIKPDKQPVGKSDSTNPFTTHMIGDPKGLTFYLFTDGFADQFGGANGKKFKYRQLGELVLSISHNEPQEQLEQLQSAFDTWRGELEQVDDVCVIGIKV